MNIGSPFLHSSQFLCWNAKKEGRSLSIPPASSHYRSVVWRVLRGGWYQVGHRVLEGGTPGVLEGKVGSAIAQLVVSLVDGVGEAEHDGFEEAECQGACLFRSLANDGGGEQASFLCKASEQFNCLRTKWLSHRNCSFPASHAVKMFSFVPLPWGDRGILSITFPGGFSIVYSLLFPLPFRVGECLQTACGAASHQHSLLFPSHCTSHISFREHVWTESLQPTTRCLGDSGAVHKPIAPSSSSKAFCLRFWGPVCSGGWYSPLTFVLT